MNTNPFTATMPKLENVTEKYRFIPTSEFIGDVTKLGYNLESTSSPRRGLGMHSMVFTHPGLPAIDGLSMRLLATNSHDATSAFRLYIQVLVQVCSNGLVAWRTDGDTSARIVHRGYAIDKVAEAVSAVRAKFEGVLTTVNQFQERNVTPELAADFIREAAKLRDAQPYRLTDLQRVRHTPQAENNAWNVFNRVQESLVKGGYTTATEQTTPNGIAVLVPGRKARELTNIRERVQVNTKLWQLALEKLLA